MSMKFRWTVPLLLVFLLGVFASTAVAQKTTKTDSEKTDSEKTESKKSESKKSSESEKEPKLADDGEDGELQATGAPEPQFSGADIAWMLVASALVLMMTAPGLALFYGGLVRKKNILGVMMQCFFLMGLMSIVWALWGYSLAFGSDMLGGFIGGFDYFFLYDVIPRWEDGKQFIPREGTIPRSLHMVFQLMFFIITPALICGAFAERMKFSTMCVFSVLWGTFVYCPIAHWVWSTNGWLFTGDYAAFDFAGGTVVHISSGVSALVCCLILGKRLGYGQEPMPPHNLTYTCIGAAMLWVGWFGFNAGSALGANVSAVNAFVATHLAASAGVLAWAGAEWTTRGKPSILGACSGPSPDWFVSRLHVERSLRFTELLLVWPVASGAFSPVPPSRKNSDTTIHSTPLACTA